MSRVPIIGPEVPHRGGTLSRRIAAGMLALLGWKIEGNVPNIRKFVLIGAPHSSNWDFIFAMPAVFALGLKVQILGKHTLLKGPLAPLMRYCGIVPVDRSSPHGVVGDSVRAIVEAERMIIGIAPEGTRTPGAKWKSGFWQIARQAGVPIVPVALDYGTRTFRIGEAVMPGAVIEPDMEILSRFYEGTKGAKRIMHGPLPLRPPGSAGS